MHTMPTVTNGNTFLVLALLLAVPFPAVAQPAESLIRDLSWRSIGNANQKGRISSIDALDDDWTHVVVGTASGGVFKSTNGGTTWDAIFERYGAASIGDVAIFDGNPDIIWVGTGEECGRNSAAWGDGLYKSTDGGQTFTHVGLRDTYTIGSVLLHPTNPDLVYVAATGNIWGDVGDRGLFRSRDGGRTWQKLTNGLPNDARTGALYAVMDPRDPNVIYVSFWERKRTAWILDSGGPNGGIFKTTDGGETWQKLTNGLPEGPSGKIGLAVSRTSPNVLMAHYEHEYRPAQNSPEFEDMSRLGTGIYRSEDAGASWRLTNRSNSRPFYYNHVAISAHDPEKTYHYNQNFQVSEDGGRTLQGQQVTGGHCYHAIWLDPHNEKRYWIGSDGGLNLTHDGGETWLEFKNINATQYYFVGADMRDPYFVCGGLQDAGTSCGPSMTRANGIYLDEWYNLQGGDGYFAAMDPVDWRYVYTGQDPKGTGSAVSRNDVLLRTRTVIRPMKGLNILNYDERITPEMEQANIAKGWGEPVVGRQSESRADGSGAFRWNWASPIVLSPFGTPRVLYVGANHLFRTADRGETWTIISPELSKNDPIKTRKPSGGLTPDEVPGGGAEHYGTIVTIGESPVQPGTIWVGTDDGNVQLTRDGGTTWTNVAPNIPGLPSQELYISRVKPSRFDAATAFVTIDGHESAIFRPFVFKTTDYGATWTNITANLPDGHPIYAIEQDTKNPDLLFTGSEFAIFFSIDGGRAWNRFNQNLPTAAVHDIMVHPRDPDIIIATHGRGIWILDDISGLQQLTPAVTAKDGHLFDNEVATRWVSQQPMHNGGSIAFAGENPTRNAVINYWLGAGARGPVTIEISDPATERTRSCTVEAASGLGQLVWNLQFTAAPGERGGGGRGGRGGFGGGGRGGRGGRGGGAPDPCGPGGSPADAGTYRVTLTVNGQTHAGAITVRDDPQFSQGR
jgi:photosystem II stability/assembly factor-like uncharacterized protein